MTLYSSTPSSNTCLQTRSSNIEYRCAATSMYKTVCYTDSTRKQGKYMLYSRINVSDCNYPLVIGPAHSNVEWNQVEMVLCVWCDGQDSLSSVDGWVVCVWCDRQDNLSSVDGWAVCVWRDRPEGQQWRHIGEHGVPPHGVCLVGDDHVVLVRRDGVVQRGVVVIIVRWREVILYTAQQNNHLSLRAVTRATPRGKWSSHCVNVETLT